MGTRFEWMSEFHCFLISFLPVAVRKAKLVAMQGRSRPCARFHFSSFQTTWLNGEIWYQHFWSDIWKRLFNEKDDIACLANLFCYLFCHPFPRVFRFSFPNCRKVSLGHPRRFAFLFVHRTPSKTVSLFNCSPPLRINLFPFLGRLFVIRKFQN